MDKSTKDDKNSTILHVDMDAFYVSVEMQRDPRLRNKPVIVGGSGARGVVSSAGYLARKYGVHSAMPIGQARRLCPHAIFLPVDMAAYLAASRQVMEILKTITPLVEQISVDEAFLDISGVRHLLGSPQQIAMLVRARISAELGLPCSVGVASTKFVAKLASDNAKPDGLLIVPAAQALLFLRPLPVRALWGVGKQTYQVLHNLGISTVADVERYPLSALRRAVGLAAANHLHELSHGRDPRRVSPQRQDRSVGVEETYQRDITQLPALRAELLRLANMAAQRLRAAGYVARTVVLKVKFADFTIATRSRTLANPTNLARELYTAACQLWDTMGLHQPRVRLLGIRGEQLISVDKAVTQLLFDNDISDRWQKAEDAVDQVFHRFGAGSLRPATLLKSPEQEP